MGARFNVELAIDAALAEAGAKKAAASVDSFTTSVADYTREAKQASTATQQFRSAADGYSASVRSAMSEVRAATQVEIQNYKALMNSLQALMDLNEARRVASAVAATGVQSETALASSIRNEIVLQRDIAQAVRNLTAARKLEAIAEGNIESTAVRIAALREEVAAYAQGAQAVEAFRVAQGISAGVAAIGPNTAEQTTRASALVEEEIRLRNAVEEASVAMRNADAVEANVGAIQARTVALQEQLAAYKAGSVAAALYDEQAAVSKAVVLSGASVGSPQAAEVERNVLLQRQLQQELDNTAVVAERSGARGMTAWDHFGRVVQTVLLYTLVYAIGNVSVEMVKAEVQFNTSMTKINTLVGISKDITDQWRESILKIAVETGQGPDELARAMFAVTSSGLRGAAAMDALDASAKAAAIGLGDQAVIARTATAAVQVYGEKNLTATQAVSILVGAVREGNVPVDQFAGAMARVLPLAKDFGVTMDQVAGIVATYTRVGADANVATTGLRAIFASLLQDAEGKGAKALAQFGTSAAAVKAEIKDKGLLQALVDLVGRFGDNDEALKKVFGNIRGFTEVLAVVKDQTQQYGQIQKSITDSINTGLQTAFDLWKKTPEAAFKQLGVVAKEFGMNIAQGLIPALNQASALLREMFSSDQTAAKAWGAALGKILVDLVRILKFVADHWDAISFALKTMMALKVAGWFSTIVEGSNLAALGGINLGKGFGSAFADGSRLVALDIKTALNNWVTSINLVYAALIILGIAINNIITAWGQASAAETQAMVKNNAGGDTFRQLRTSIASGSVTREVLNNSAETRKKLVDDLHAMIAQAEAADVQIKKLNSDVPSAKGAANLGDKSWLEKMDEQKQSMALADAGIKEDMIRLKNIDQLIAKTKDLKIIEVPVTKLPPAVPPLPPVPKPDKAFAKQMGDLNAMKDDAQRLRDIELTVGSTVANLQLQLQNQQRGFSNNVEAAMKAAQATKSASKEQDIFSSVLQQAVAAGKLESDINLAMAAAERQYADELRNSKQQKEIDQALTVAKTTAETSKGRQIVSAIQIEQSANLVKEQSIDATKRATEAIKNTAEPTLKLATLFSVLDDKQVEFASSIGENYDQAKIVLGNFASSTDEVNKAMTALAPVAKSSLAGFKATDVVTSVVELQSNIGNLQAALLKLDPSSKQYASTNKALIDSQATLNKALEKMPLLLQAIRVEQDKPAEQSIRAFNDEIAAIRTKNAMLAKGQEWLSVYERQEQAFSSAVQLASQLIRRSGESDIDLFNRRSAALSAALAAERESIAAERQAKLDQPYHDFLNNIESSAADIFSRIATNGYHSLSDMFKAVTDSALQMVQQFLKAWIEAQIRARVEAAITAAQQRALNSQYGGVFSGGKTQLDTASVAPASTQSGAEIGTVAGWALAAYALFVVYKVFANDTKTWSGEATIGLNGATASLKSIGSYARQAGEAITSLIASIKDLSTQLHLGIVQLTAGSVSINLNSHGEIVVKTMIDAVGRVFKDMAAALDYAKTQALKFASYGSSVSDLVRNAIQRSQATTTTGLQSDIDFANKLDAARLGETGQRLHEILQTMVEDFRRAVDLFGPLASGLRSLADLSQLGPATAAVLSSFSTSLQALYDQLTGHKEDAKQVAEMQRQAYNAQRAIIIAQIYLLIEEVKARIAAYQATLLGLTLFQHRPGGDTGAGDGSDPTGPGGTLLKGGGVLHIDVRNPTGDAAIAALLQVLDNLTRALQGLPPDIGPGGVVLGGGHGGGAGKQIPAWQTLLIQHAHDQLSPIAQSIDDVNKKYDEAVKSAKKNKDAITQLNVARQQEIDAILKTARAAAISDSNDIIGAGDSAQAMINQFTKIEEAAAKQKKTNEDLAKVGGLTAAELRRLNIAIDASVRAQEAAIVTANKKNDQAFIDAGDPIKGGVNATIDAITSKFDELVKANEDLVAAGKMTDDEMRQLNLAMQESARAQQRRAIDGGFNDLLSQLYGILGDDKAAAQLKYDLTIAELQIKREELFIAVTNLGLMNEHYKNLFATIDILIGKVIAGGPTLFQGGGGSGGGNPSAQNQSASDYDNALKLLRDYQLKQLSPLDQELLKLNEDFASIRQSLGNTIEVQQAYAFAMHEIINKYFQPLRDLQSSLNSSDSSPLSAQQKFNQAQSAFFSAASALQHGDYANLDKFPQLANDLLAAAKLAMPSGSQAYVALFNTVQAIISSILANVGVPGAPGVPGSGAGQPPYSGGAVPPVPPPGGQYPAPTIPSGISVDPIVQQIAASGNMQVIELRSSKIVQQQSADLLSRISNGIDKIANQGLSTRSMS